MKKLFLSLAFVFATVFSFAEENSNKTSFADSTCVSVTLSCGITGWACGETTAEIIANVIAADAALCPPQQ